MDPYSSCILLVSSRNESDGGERLLSPCYLSPLGELKRKRIVWGYMSIIVDGADFGDLFLGFCSQRCCLFTTNGCSPLNISLSHSHYSSLRYICSFNGP